jgi:hypothetical protein
MEKIDDKMLEKSFVAALARAGIGSKKRLPEAYQLAQQKLVWRERAAPITVTGAGMCGCGYGYVGEWVSG